MKGNKERDGEEEGKIRKMPVEGNKKRGMKQVVDIRVTIATGRPWSLTIVMPEKPGVNVDHTSPLGISAWSECWTFFLFISLLQSINQPHYEWPRQDVSATPSCQ